MMIDDFTDIIRCQPSQRPALDVASHIVSDEGAEALAKESAGGMKR
jgi:hypothetical protein